MPAVAAIGGLEYFINHQWALTMEYRYEYIDSQGSIRTSLPGVTPTIHAVYKVDGLGNNLFTAGISHYFF